MKDIQILKNAFNSVRNMGDSLEDLLISLDAYAPEMFEEFEQETRLYFEDATEEDLNNFLNAAYKYITNY